MYELNPLNSYIINKRIPDGGFYPRHPLYLGGPVIIHCRVPDREGPA